jgi:dipeptidyl aminopeptidase/acylaminoacyl peptidase
MTTRRTIAAILPACLALGLLAPHATRAAPAATPAATSPAAAPGTTAPSAAGYRGHGVGSLDPAALVRFAPRPIDAALQRTIQQMLDLRAPPGGGLPSDDGRRLFFSWRVTGSTQVWRLDGPDRFPIQLTAGEDTTTVAAVTPDGKTLVVQRDRKGEENPGLYLMSAEGGPLQALQHLEGVQTTFERLSPDGRTLYYRANDRAPDAYALYARDLASGVTTTILAEPGLWSIADRRPDGRLLIARATGSLTSEWFEWSPVTRALTPLLGQGESSELEVRYAAQEGELLVQTNKLGDLRRLYRWKGGAFTPITPELRWDVGHFAIDEAQRRILYSVNEGGYARLHALDARTFQPLPLPRLPAADQVNAGATTRDGRYTVISIDTGTAPRASWVLDWRSGALTRWVVPSAPEVDLSRFSRATLETYPARDGTSIPVFVSRPARCPAEPCPVLVSFHGGPEAQALPGFSPAIQLFLDAGFVVVQPNVRGSDGYGKAWLAADDGPRRLQVITDIEDAGRWARKAFAANDRAPRVGIMGGSYGGYSTLIGMTMFAGTFDAGASNVGISNLVTFLENTAPYRRVLRISEYGDPARDREVLVKLSPITYVDRVKGPLLIMQGASDPRVPAGEAIQIHDALAARGVPVELLIFPDEGHGAQKRENVAQALGRQLEFFKKYLGAAPGDPATSAPVRTSPPPTGP